jgi:hypothetical protein
MPLTSWPRAYFEWSRGDLRAAADEVVTLAATKLRCEYRSVERAQSWPFPQLRVDSGKESMIVSVRPYSRGISVLVVPLQGWSLLDVFRGKELGAASGLQTLCTQIHTVLLDVPDVVGLRWYLKGVKESVGTPDELPW